MNEKSEVEEETAKVYADFVKSFEPEEKGACLVKTFVRAGAALGFDSKEDEPAALYRPTKKSFWAPPPSAPPIKVPPPNEALCASLSAYDAKSASDSAKQKEIDRVLREMKERQSLLDQRRELRRILSTTVSPPERLKLKSDLERVEYMCGAAGADMDETTNLYVGNLAPDITEEMLLNEFQQYGPVASVKIMYPRTPDEMARSRNCGFVSFVARADAEEARAKLDGKEMRGMGIRIGWGKPLLRSLSIDTSSPPGESAEARLNRIRDDGFEGDALLSNLRTAVESSELRDRLAAADSEGKLIRVNAPTNLEEKLCIDLVAKAVAENGYYMEQALLMDRGDQPEYQWLWDRSHPSHIYYRWRVLSEVQGDTVKRWQATPFRVFENGWFWIPPSQTETEIFPQLMSQWPETATDPLSTGLLGAGRRPLSPKETEEFETIVQTLTRTNTAIKNGMVFCLQRAESSVFLTRILLKHIMNETNDIQALFSRVYLMSDILHNTFSTKPSAWTYRLTVERCLPDVFCHLARVKKSLPPIVAEVFDSRVVAILLAWHGWAIYSPELLEGLEATYFTDPYAPKEALLEAAVPPVQDAALVDEAVDGEPFPDAWLMQHLVSVPWWLRSDYMSWLDARDDMTALEKICQSQGVLVSGNTYGTAEVLIKRLLERAEYVLNKRREEMKLGVLVSTAVAPESSPVPIAAAANVPPTADAVVDMPHTLSIADVLANPPVVPKKPVDPKVLSTWLASDLNKVKQMRESQNMQIEPPASELMQEEPPVSETVTDVQNTVADETPMDEDDDMFGLVEGEKREHSPNHPGKTTTESKDTHLHELEKEVMKLGRSLRDRHLADDEIQIRCDALRLRLLEDMQEDD